MKTKGTKIIKIIVGVLLACLLIVIILFVALYFTRFQTMGTIQKLTNYEDGYDLYSMTVKYNYDIQDVIDYGVEDSQDAVDAVAKEALPLLPIKTELPSFTCSAYRAQSDNGDVIMGRNYDFKNDTSCMLVKCNPKDGYSSVACAALNNIFADRATESLKTKLPCLMLPFCCLDGINEKGVSIAILTLDSEPTDQSTGLEKITANMAVRLVLDNAATTQEAVDIIRGYDMLGINGRDYHFFISDATGDSRAVEYDCEDEARTLIDTPIQAITNFYARYIDKVEPFQKNGIYGHGKERYDYMMEVINKYDGVLNEEQSWEALRAAATEPTPGDVTSNTQWSIIFNNTDPTADVVVRRHWGDDYLFSVE